MPTQSITLPQYLNTVGGRNLQSLIRDYKCGQCKKQFDKPWVVPTGKPFPDNVEPNVQIAFHWEDSHGFPHDMFYDMVMKAVQNCAPLES